MVYQRSQEIESRLAELLRLIQSGRYSTPKLATALGVSHPTISRCICALRERGYSIHSAKSPEGWAYQIAEKKEASSSSSSRRRP